MRVIVPLTGNETIAMVKDTSLFIAANVITELYYQSTLFVPASRSCPASSPRRCGTSSSARSSRSASPTREVLRPRLRRTHRAKRKKAEQKILAAGADH